MSICSSVGVTWLRVKMIEERDMYINHNNSRLSIHIMGKYTKPHEIEHRLL